MINEKYQNLAKQKTNHMSCQPPCVNFLNAMKY